MREQEVGVFDFVLLDEITLDKFMQNLRKRYVWNIRVWFLCKKMKLTKEEKKIIEESGKKLLL